jgi:hypothetical protein
VITHGGRRACLPVTPRLLQEERQTLGQILREGGVVGPRRIDEEERETAERSTFRDQRQDVHHAGRERVQEGTLIRGER